MNIGALIMAGGKGERFWPASTRDNPKQLNSFGMQHSLLVQTIERIRPLIPISRQLILTNASLIPKISGLLPDFKSEQIIGEPVGRNTAPCVAVAALWMAHYYGPDCIMLVLSADHYIAKADVFLEILKTGIEAAQSEHLVTIGLQPKRPETGYGYIELGKALNEETGLFEVERFIEKPDLTVAQKFHLDGQHLWNGGMFLWKCSKILEELQHYLPELVEKLDDYRKALGTQKELEILESLFPQLPEISIDYGVMEKAEKVVTVKADIDWDDLGNWEVLERLQDVDANGNTVLGPHVGVETQGCVISVDEGLVATLGVRDLVIVKQGSVVLVMPKEKAAELKKLVHRLNQDSQWESYL